MGPLAEKRFLRAGKGAESTKEKSRQCFTHDEVSLTTQSQGVKKVGITNWKETLKNIQSETSSQPN
jgi:predicted adenine nucleotide alpha hydrolase (AANH) superfamily ATPase